MKVPMTQSFVNSTCESLQQVINNLYILLTDLKVQDGESNDETDTSSIFIVVYAALLFTSDFFILATILIFARLKDERSKLLGQLTIGFIINLPIYPRKNLRR